MLHSCKGAESRRAESSFKEAGREVQGNEAVDLDGEPRGSRRGRGLLEREGRMQNERGAVSLRLAKR